MLSRPAVLAWHSSCSVYVAHIRPSLVAHLQIIQVNLTTADPVLVSVGAKLDFKFSVNWIPTKTPFSRRFERYLDYTFFEHKVRHFEILLQGYQMSQQLNLLMGIRKP